MVAIGDPNVSIEILSSFLDINDGDTRKIGFANIALKAATKDINGFCKRQFGLTDTASTRSYYPARHPYYPHTSILTVDDFWTTDSFAIRVGKIGGSFGSPLAATRYKLTPANGILNGEPGWPFWTIELLSYWASHSGYCDDDEIQVTAKWGWAAVPSDVEQATLMLAQTYYKAIDAPLGTAGFKPFGSGKLRNHPSASLLEGYQRLLENG